MGGSERYRRGGEDGTRAEGRKREHRRGGKDYCRALNGAERAVMVRFPVGMAVERYDHAHHRHEHQREEERETCSHRYDLSSR